MNSDLCVNLNVGGSLFSTSLASLQKFPNSMLGAMFSGKYNTPQTANGTYFIDRDGTHFRHILNFLRDPESGIVELPPRQEEELKREAKYYSLFDEMFGSDPDDQLVTVAEDDQGGDSATFTRAPNGLWYQSSQPFSENSEGAQIVTVCNLCQAGFYYDTSNSCTRYIKTFGNKVNTVSIKQPRLEHKECSVCSGGKLVDFSSIENGGIVGFVFGGFDRFNQFFEMGFAQVKCTTNGEKWLVEKAWNPVDDNHDLSNLYAPFEPSDANAAVYLTKNDIAVTGLIFKSVKQGTIMAVDDAPTATSSAVQEPVFEFRLNKKSLEKIKKTDIYFSFEHQQGWY